MTLLTNRLIHLCTIQRDANAGTADSWGNPLPPDWQDHLTDQPCRVGTDTGREAINRDTVAVVQDSRLLLPTDTDVTEQDRVGDVSYRGDVLLAGPTGIRAVMCHQDHVELVLVTAS